MLGFLVSCGLGGLSGSWRAERGGSSRVSLESLLGSANQSEPADKETPRALVSRDSMIPTLMPVCLNPSLGACIHSIKEHKMYIHIYIYIPCGYMNDCCSGCF